MKRMKVQRKDDSKRTEWGKKYNRKSIEYGKMTKRG
jgi:hypothetical protein